MKFHRTIIEVGISLNITIPNVTDGGICRGYTIKWIEAYLKKQLSAYRVNLHEIKNLAENSSKIEKINYLIDELIDKKRETSSFSDDELDMFELFIFYRSLDLYQNPGINFKPKLNQKNIEKISLRLNQNDSLVCIYSETKFQSKLEMQDMFESLANKHNEEPDFTLELLAFSLCSYNHAIGIAYKDAELWQFTDINDEESVFNETYLSSEQIVDRVFDALKLYSEEQDIHSLEEGISEIATMFIQKDDDKRHPGIDPVKISFKDSHFPLIYVKEHSFWLFIDEIEEMVTEKNQRFFSTTQLAREIFMRAVNPTSFLAYSLEVIASARFDRLFKLKQRYQAFMPTSLQINPTRMNGFEIAQYAYICSVMGDVPHLKELIDERVDFSIFSQFNKLSSLHAAVQYNHIEIVKMLLNQTIDLNIQDNHGLTPVYYAVQNGFEDIFILFAELGADLTVTDKDNEGLIETANRQGYPEISAALTKYITKIKISDNKQAFFQKALDVSITNNAYPTISSLH